MHKVEIIHVGEDYAKVVCDSLEYEIPKDIAMPIDRMLIAIRDLIQNTTLSKPINHN